MGDFRGGQAATCKPDGWPFATKKQFTLFTPHDVPSYKNPLPANTNNIASHFDFYWIMFLSIAMMSGWHLILN